MKRYGVNRDSPPVSQRTKQIFHLKQTLSTHFCLCCSGVFENVTEISTGKMCLSCIGKQWSKVPVICVSFVLRLQSRSLNVSQIASAH